MKQWHHNELAEDLADIKNTPFLDIPLGSIYLVGMENQSKIFNALLNCKTDQEDCIILDNIHGVQRADVLEVKPSYTRFCISIYEIKISRQDFLNDLRSGKWRGYLDHCHRFYFAVASGVAWKEDIPPEAGLMVRGETGWKTVKAAPVREVQIPEHTMMSLIFSKQRLGHAKQRREHLLKLHRWNRDYGAGFYKALGKKLGDALRNYDEYQQAKCDLEYMKNEIKKVIKEGLGIESDWPLNDLRYLVRQIKQKAASEDL